MIESLIQSVNCGAANTAAIKAKNIINQNFMIIFFIRTTWTKLRSVTEYFLEVVWCFYTNELRFALITFSL